MVAIAEACYANDFGCSLDQLGLHEMITENQRWDSGASAHATLCSRNVPNPFIYVRKGPSVHSA